jgi:hypothetical protein
MGECDGLVGWLGRAGPASVVGAFGVVIGHLAFDDAGVGAWASFEQAAKDFPDAADECCGQSVRGKRRPVR